MTDAKELKICVHLKDGSVARFVQEDPEAIRRTLDQVRYGTVFARPALMLSSEEQLVLYPTSAITCLDLIIEPLPEDLIGPGGGEEGGDPLAWQTTEENWRQRYDGLRRDDALTRRSLGVEGDPIVVFGEIAVMGGEVFFLEFFLYLPSVGQQRQFLRHLLSQPYVPFRGKEGGLSLINPANILRHSFYPSPVPPAEAWPARAM
jgi:hypothetical protein